MWFTGPEFLSRQELLEVNNYDLVQPEADFEVRPVVTTMLTKTSNVDLGAHRFERFSNWKGLLNAVGKLLQIAKSFKKIPGKPGKGTWKCSHTSCGVDEFSQARITVLRSIQQDAYKEELDCIKRGRALLKGSSLRRLNPQVDKHGLLRVGGRLSDADLTQEEKHPVIVPPGHVSTIIIRHYHESVAHQGRHITEGAIRAAGFWVVGGKRRTCNVIKVCVTCKKLRGKEEYQLMADLPADRVTCEPPFTSVGVDVFGPWQVLARRTRGASANNKRWAVIFSCMYTRAVHLEVIESLSASSFINALRRFFAIRGPARVLRSDRGTNFVGACKELGIIAETRELRKHLLEKGCVWLFNPPHSSHMGGSWERMIGIARKILNAMLLQSKHTRLTHEILCTFLAEVMAIMNARPLVPVSCDPDQPTVLTPAMLLTQKVDATSAPAGNFDTPALHKKHWKQVQCLAENFWKRWRRDYLSSFQERKKWVDRRPNLKIGNVVLLKDNQVSRNEWPLGIIDKVYPDADGSVRKIDVRVAKDGKAKVFLRPITQVILLLSDT
ncbi:uncharacterized protein [Apostichopus japonicus]|uniref:uncharacterized protein n=1 Tax=Stichopus japonicus TaxID=307972 RepID=UPI003AB18BD6